MIFNDSAAGYAKEVGFEGSALLHRESYSHFDRFVADAVGVEIHFEMRSGGPERTCAVSNIPRFLSCSIQHVSKQGRILRFTAFQIGSTLSNA